MIPGQRPDPIKPLTDIAIIQKGPANPSEHFTRSDDGKADQNNGGAVNP